MITLFRFHVVGKVLLPTFNCYVRNVIEVNQTVVIVKFITEKWVSIVAMMTPLKANHITQLFDLLHQHQRHQHNVQEEHKKVPDAGK
jgi:hypothetical protein